MLEKWRLDNLLDQHIRSQREFLKDYCRYQKSCKTAEIIEIPNISEKERIRNMVGSIQKELKKQLGNDCQLTKKRNFNQMGLTDDSETSDNIFQENCKRKRTLDNFEMSPSLKTIAMSPINPIEKTKNKFTEIDDLPSAVGKSLPNLYLKILMTDTFTDKKGTKNEKKRIFGVGQFPHSGKEISIQIVKAHQKPEFLNAFKKGKCVELRYFRLMRCPDVTRRRTKHLVGFQLISNPTNALCGIEEKKYDFKFPVPKYDCTPLQAIYAEGKAALQLYDANVIPLDIQRRKNITFITVTDCYTKAELKAFGSNFPELRLFEPVVFRNIQVSVRKQESGVTFMNWIVTNDFIQDPSLCKPLIAKFNEMELEDVERMKIINRNVSAMKEQKMSLHDLRNLNPSAIELDAKNRPVPILVPLDNMVFTEINYRSFNNGLNVPYYAYDTREPRKTKLRSEFPFWVNKFGQRIPDQFVGFETKLVVSFTEKEKYKSLCVDQDEPVASLDFCSDTITVFGDAARKLFGIQAKHLHNLHKENGYCNDAEIFEKDFNQSEYLGMNRTYKLYIKCGKYKFMRGGTESYRVSKTLHSYNIL